MCSWSDANWNNLVFLQQNRSFFFDSTKEEDVQPPPGLSNLDGFSIKPQIDQNIDPNLESIWTPSRKCELNSPTPMVTTSSNTELAPQTTTISHTNKLSLESPPEAAIEATPETTPFVTPVKVRMLGHFFVSSIHLSRGKSLLEPWDPD